MKQRWRKGLPAFSREGKQLACPCYTVSGDFGLFIVTSAARLKLIKAFPPECLSGIAWTADDKRLIFEGEGYPLRELSIASGSIRDLPFGEEAGSLTISAKSEQLAYDIQSGGDSNIWRCDLFHPQALPIKLIFTLAVTYRKNGGREGTRTPGPLLAKQAGSKH
jgi:hypothetical protein